MVQVVEGWLRGWRDCTPCLQRGVLQMEYVDRDIGQWASTQGSSLKRLGQRLAFLWILFVYKQP
jgi:hypothetical protein